MNELLLFILASIGLCHIVVDSALMAPLQDYLRRQGAHVELLPVCRLLVRRGGRLDPPAGTVGSVLVSAAILPLLGIFLTILVEPRATSMRRTDHETDHEFVFVGNPGAEEN